MEGAIPAIVTLVGVALTTLGFWRDFPDFRSRRYSERFNGLLEMSDKLSLRGPYVAPYVVAAAATAHEAMLAALDLEARANAAMYLNSAGRLRRPGSTSVVVAMVAYGIVITWVVLAAVPSGEPISVTTTVSQNILLAIALASLVGGIRSGGRRWRSRSIRLTIGHDDELTVVWWKRVGTNIREKRAARRNNTEAAASV